MAAHAGGRGIAAAAATVGAESGGIAGDHVASVGCDGAGVAVVDGGRGPVASGREGVGGRTSIAAADNATW